MLPPPSSAAVDTIKKTVKIFLQEEFTDSKNEARFSS
jgi:hypothetical protein